MKKFEIQKYGKDTIICTNIRFEEIEKILPRRALSDIFNQVDGIKDKSGKYTKFCKEFMY